VAYPAASSPKASKPALLRSNAYPAIKLYVFLRRRMSLNVTRPEVTLHAAERRSRPFRDIGRRRVTLSDSLLSIIGIPGGTPLLFRSHGRVASALVAGWRSCRTGSGHQSTSPRSVTKIMLYSERRQP
jgi:hypothetical protein